MGILCSRGAKLYPAGPPEAAGEGSLSNHDVADTNSPRSKGAWFAAGGGDSRRSSIFSSSPFLNAAGKGGGGKQSSFLPGASSVGKPLALTGSEASGALDLDIDTGGTMVFALNLAEFQSTLDSVPTDSILNLQGKTISQDASNKLQGGCLSFPKSVCVVNGTLLLPPYCPVEAASHGCIVTFVHMTISSPKSSTPIVIARKHAELRMETCTISGGNDDAVQVRGVGSCFRAKDCQISSVGGGAAVSAILGGHASMIDCTLQGWIGIDVADADSKVFACQCAMDGSAVKMGTGVAVSDGAFAELESCTIHLQQHRGLHATGKGSHATAKSCGMNKCGVANVGVYDGAAVALEDCTCNLSTKGFGIEVGGMATRLHAVNVTASECYEHNVNITGGASAHFVGCTMDSGGAYGIHVADRGTTANFVGCRISDSDMQNVVVAGGATAHLQKCRTYGSKVYGLNLDDPRKKWGWVMLGATSRLHAVECYWSPTPPPQLQVLGTSRKASLALPSWLR